MKKERLNPKEYTMFPIPTVLLKTLGIHSDSIIKTEYENGKITISLDNDNMVDEDDFCTENCENCLLDDCCPFDDSDYSCNGDCDYCPHEKECDESFGNETYVTDKKEQER